MVDSIDEAKQQLYQEGVAEFVAARDAMAKEVRLAGNRELATAIKTLRKPSVAAAALNHALHLDADAIEHVIDAVEELRDGQAAMVSGESVDLVHLQRIFRAAAAEIAERAEAHQLEVQSAIEAAAIDPNHHEALRAGTFSVLPTPTAGVGFGELPAGFVPKPRSEPTRTTQSASSGSKTAKQAARPTRANTESDAADTAPDPRVIRAAMRAAETAARTAAKAEREVTKADGTVAEIEEEIASLKARLTRSRKQRDVESRRADELRAAATSAVTEAAAARSVVDEFKDGS